MHEVEPAQERVLVHAPEQPVGVRIVREPRVDDVGNRGGVQVRERPLHQLARLQRDVSRRRIEPVAQERDRLLGDDLEVAGKHPACAGLHPGQYVPERAVGNDVVRHQEDEARVAHGAAGLANDARIGQRDRCRVVAIRDEVVDQMDFRFANPGKMHPRWMHLDRPHVVDARHDDEPARQRLRQRRHIAGRQQCRQTEFQELPDETMAPHRQQHLYRLHRPPRCHAGRRGGLSRRDGRDLVHCSLRVCIRLML